MSIPNNVITDRQSILVPKTKYSKTATDNVDRLRITITVGTLTYLSANRLEISIVTNNKTRGVQIFKIAMFSDGIDSDPTGNK